MSLYRVVIVDDEPFMLEGMRLMIDWEACGFALSGEAHTAQEALHLMDALRPHLLITDVRMPGMLGTDLAEIARRYHPETVVLFFSGYRDFSYAQAAIRSHAFGYLVKPIDSDEVHATLRAVKAELDKRGGKSAGRSPVLRDLMLRRLAWGDKECLPRAAVLLELKRDTPCYCAVLQSDAALSESAQFLLPQGAFLLSPTLFGMVEKRVERDTAGLTALKERLESAYPLHIEIAGGGVGRGEEGFYRSLQEAMDALGLLYETQDGLRCHHPCDGDTVRWLSAAQPERVAEALTRGDESALARELKRVRELAARERPALFALRYMAHATDMLLTMAGVSADLRPLWARDADSRADWLNAYERRLTALPKRARDAEDAPPAVRTALDYVRDHYAERLSIGELAERVGMNPAYLGQLIRRGAGRTFHQLLLDTRLTHACRMLRQTTRPVGHIEAEVGFRDVDYFSAQFRARMGATPNAYRCAERKGTNEALYQ